MTEAAHISGKKLLEMPIGEVLRVVFSACGIAVLLVRPVPMVSELMHEDVEQHVSPGLWLGKAAHHPVRTGVERNPEAQEYIAMRFEVPWLEFLP